MGLPQVKRQNFPTISKIVMGVTKGQKAKFLKNSQDHRLGSLRVKKQNFPRIPKIVIWGHLRSKSKFPKNFQDPRSIGGQRSFEVIRS
ncbi:hypothetical protein HOLleu_30619 [Holothuria leucospilota]|uniref:Uncharacterized protein n=1 Tax=Holothuria leucospilota TaxID=206669 RepID=A0A9Q1BKY1_HOLLE|nr:hypothetical protein HOLleu_30619 [Holothuria leucospilota]